MSDSNTQTAAPPAAPATQATTTEPEPKSTGIVGWVKEHLGLAETVAEDAAKAVTTPAPPAPACSLQAVFDGLITAETKALVGPLPGVAEVDAFLASVGIPYTIESLVTTGATNAVAAVFDHLGAQTSKVTATGGAK